MAAPFGEAMAEDQRVIGAAQRVEHHRGLGDFDRGDGHYGLSVLIVIASEAKQSIAQLVKLWIASSLRSSQ
jgi:hypothetical protein